MSSHEPFLALLQIDQQRPDRPRRRRTAEDEAHAGLFVDDLDRRKQPPLRRQAFEERAGNEMAMRIDVQ